MKYIGCFHEMKLFEDGGSIKDYLAEKVNYDKEKVVKYLESFERYAGCPRNAIDCVTGEVIEQSFLFYCDKDKEYSWCSFLPYHVEKYNIRLPDDFLDKIEKDTGERVKL